jgi:transcriptional regulator with XRE-family HTH domain
MNASEMIEYRKRRNMNMPQLATFLGVHKSAITRWEKGEREIPHWVPRVIALDEELKRCRAKLLKLLEIS